MLKYGETIQEDCRLLGDGKIRERVKIILYIDKFRLIFRFKKVLNMKFLRTTNYYGSFRQKSKYEIIF